MSIRWTKARRRAALLTGFVLVWLIAALWTTYLVKPEFWRDGYSYFRQSERLSEKGDTQGALTAIDKALGRDANNAGYLVFKGSLEEKAGRVDNAEVAYRRALELKPDDPEAALGLAKLLLAAGKDRQAGEALAILPADKLDTPLLQRRAGLLAQHGEHAGAMADYERLLAGSPNNTDYLRALAASAMAVQDWARAEQALSRLLPLAGDGQLATWTRDQLVLVLRAAHKPEAAYELLASDRDAATLALRAELAMELGKFAQAKPLLEEIVKADPGDAKVKNQLAIALRALGQPAEAYALFASVPDSANLRARAELALELENFTEAATLYDAMAKQQPNDVAIKERLAYALDRAAQASHASAAEAAAKAAAPQPIDAAAEKQYRQALASGEASEETRVRYAWLLMRAKRYAEALDALGEAARADARPEVLELAANAAFLAGKYDRAVAFLTALSKLQPANASVWRNLADAHDALKQTSPAVRAMEQYVALASNDTAATLKLAGLLNRDGQKDRAEAIYRKILEEDPGDMQAVMGLATLYESRHKFAAAIAVLSRALDGVSDPAPEALSQLARLYGYAKRYAEAARTYARLLAMKGLDPNVRAASERGLAEASVEAGDAARALKVLGLLRAWDSRDPRLLLLAARASMLGADPAQAVKALENLSARRPLKPVETVWLAGQYRLLGRKSQALALYEKALAAGELPTAQDYEALGDLRFDAGRFKPALAAYQRAAATGDADKLAIKIARAANRSGDKALARAAYERFLASNPKDPALLLEIARFNTSAGQYAQALTLYDRVVAAQGSKGLLLELALANLAAKRFDTAETWSRQAIQAGEGGYKATLALVQSLHLQGKTLEADTLLQQHRHELMAHPQGREWIGYVDVARDRQLEAYDLFTALAKENGPDQGKMWLWRGIAATRRGDYRRARESFRKARELGVQAPEGQEAQ
ncbi:hypothetical protein JCM15519_31710 [Fundidesulfovibrio butyratiphilus]